MLHDIKAIPKENTKIDITLLEHVAIWRTQIIKTSKYDEIGPL